MLLALSGGADSMALLEMLSEQSCEDGFPLYAAHVDHGIRGEEARRDRDFCRRMAAEYEVELFVLEADVPALAKEHGRGLEEEARCVRYEFFARVMKEKEIPILVTAHHADDNLETVLFRMCRGSALGGLCGIAPVREIEGGTLVRPLLHATKEELIAYCEAHELEYVTDSTNTDTAYTRNAIRHKVLPALAALFPDAPLRVSATCEGLREDERFLQQLADSFLKEHETPAGLSVCALRDAPGPVRSRALERYVRERIGAQPERVHVDAMETLLLEKNGGRVALPQDFYAAVEQGFLTVLSKDCYKAENFCIPCIPDTPHIKNGCVFGLEYEKKTKVHNLSTTLYINLTDGSAIIKDSLFWRPRAPGDVLLMGGMHRRLRRLYAACGLPPRLRARVPLLCDGEGIVWAPMVGLRDGLPTEGVPCTAYLELSGADAEWNIYKTVKGKGKGQKDVSN